MAAFIYKIIFIIGLMSMIHTGYSAAEQSLYASYEGRETCLNRLGGRDFFCFFSNGLEAETSNAFLEDRAKLRVIEQDYASLPSDIILQGLVSLIVMMYGVLYSAGDFKEIRATIQLENKSWETVGNRPSFYSFCHRGRSLTSDSPAIPKCKASYNNFDTADS